MKKGFCLLIAICLALPMFATAYDDLDNYDWAKESIDALTAQGVVNGVEQGRFDPEGNVTYEQLAKMLVLGFVMDTAQPEQPTYQDVDKDRWSFPYVEAAKAYFNITGDAFHPEEAVPRIEVVRAVTSAVTTLGEIGKIHDFADGDKMTEEEEQWAAKAVELGIVTGYPDNTFRPEALVSRAEAAVLLARAVKAAAATSPVPTVTPTPTSTATATPEATAAPTATPSATATPAPTSDASLDARMDFFVVSALAKVSLDGDETTRVTGYYAGDKQEFTCEKAKIVRADDTETEAEIAVGDVISATRDIGGRVRNVTILFSVADKYQGDDVYNPYGDGKVARYSAGSMDFLYGLVRLRNSNTLLLAFDDTVSDKTDANSGMCALDENTVYYIYNPATKNVKLADLSDVMADSKASETPVSDMGSFVFVRATDYLAQDVYIISNR